MYDRARGEARSDAHACERAKLPSQEFAKADRHTQKKGKSMLR